MTASSTGWPSIAACPTTIASPRPGVELRLGEPLRVRPQVEEVERVVGADVGRLLDERARVGVPRDPRAGRHREVVAAVAADPECGLELVVAVVRAALGAGVRVLLRLTGAERACARPGRRSGPRPLVELRPPPVRDGCRSAAPRPSACPRRVRARSLRAEATRPVKPAPTGRGKRREQPLELVGGEPARLGHEDVELRRVDHVEVERDVDVVLQVAELLPDAGRLDELLLGRVEVPGAEQRHVLRRRRRRRRSASAAACPRRCRTATTRACSGRRARRSRRSRAAPWRRASSRTAPTCAQQQPPRTSGRSGSSRAIAAICSARLSSSTTAASGHGGAIRARRPSTRRRRPTRAARATALRRTRGRTHDTGTPGRSRRR